MTQILIGWLLVIFHIKINGFDLLPDFLGYILIATGLNDLSEQSEQFAKARPLAIAMAVISTATLAQQLFGVEGFGLFTGLVGLAAVLLCLVIQYRIALGVRDLEQLKNTGLGAEKLMKIWKVLIILQPVTWVICNGFLFVPVAVMALAAACFIAEIAYVVCFYKTKKLYESA